MNATMDPPLTSTALDETYTHLTTHLAPEPTLTPKEAHLLSLIAQQRELALQLAVLKAYTTTRLPTHDPTPQELSTAQEAFTTAHAQHTLRQRILTRAQTAAPLAAATHAPETADPRLVTGLRTRDTLAMLQSVALTAVTDARASLAETARKGRKVMGANERAAERMLGMVAQVGDEEGQLGRVSEEMRGRIESEEGAVKKARAEWRVMKGVVGGVVVGSGVDWASDETLCELVMEAEDELES
jgi:Centromere protein H (CENP-H)